MRWERRDDLDSLPSPEPPVRVEALRVLVDGLPELERYLVERTYFGGEDLAKAGREIGLTPKQSADVRDRGLAELRRAVLEDHALGVMPPARA